MLVRELHDAQLVAAVNEALCAVAIDAERNSGQASSGIRCRRCAHFKQCIADAASDECYLYSGIIQAAPAGQQLPAGSTDGSMQLRL